MAKLITAADVQAAEAALIAAKKGKDPKKRQTAMDECVKVRSAWRLQEEAAGRRSGLISISED